MRNYTDYTKIRQARRRLRRSVMLTYNILHGCPPKELRTVTEVDDITSEEFHFVVDYTDVLRQRKRLKAKKHAYAYRHIGLRYSE